MIDAIDAKVDNIQFPMNAKTAAPDDPRGEADRKRLFDLATGFARLSGTFMISYSIYPFRHSLTSTRR